MEGTYIEKPLTFPVGQESRAVSAVPPLARESEKGGIYPLFSFAWHAFKSGKGKTKRVRCERRKLSQKGKRVFKKPYGFQKES